MNIAIIPARGGSKRIPRKNIKSFANKPMIAHAISAALSSELFEQVIVSTDDEEIAEIANNWGAKTPFIRPAELANDYTATAPVIAHAIKSCEEIGWQIDYVCCIYPCVPFIQIADLRTTFMLLNQSESGYAFPIAEYPSAIQRALKQNSDGKLSAFYPEHELTRTQDLTPAYYDAGQFYWGKKLTWLNNPNIHNDGVGHVIPKWRAIDIDTLEDWHCAEMFYNFDFKETGE